MNKKLRNKINKVVISALAASMILNAGVSNVYAKDTEAKSKTEYVLCKSNGEVKKYILADDEANKLQYMDKDESYPIKATVSYKVDGKACEASDMAGVDGKVEIDIKFEGDEENYTALTFLLLDEKHFSDIEINGGRVISDGDKSIVLGITKIPGTLHIETKANKFENKMMYTIATNSLLNDVDLEDFAPVLGIDISSIKDTIKSLQSVIDEGDDSDMSLSEGISELTGGISQLSDGLTTLDENSDQLVGGARQVFQSLIDMANDEIAKTGEDIPKLTISNYSSVLSKVINQASPEGVNKTAKATVESKVRANEALIRAGVEQAVTAEVTNQVTEKVKETVEENVISAMGFTKADYNNALAAGLVSAETVNKVVAGKLAEPEIQAKIAAGVSEQMATSKVKKIINEKTEEQVAALVDKNVNAPEVQAQIAAGVAKGSAATPSLKALKTKLDSYNKFYQGLIQYTDGVSKASEGAAVINSATSEISGSTSSLLNDDSLGLINDADKLLDKAGAEKNSVKYIIKFDSIR